jgi:NADH:ubiquinone oxidoreductase subunit 6 (subunit J)
MESQNTNQSLFDFNINENVKTHMRSAAVWAGSAAILSLVGAIIGIIRSVVQKNTVREYNRFEGFGQPRVTTSSSGGMLGAVISLIVAILLFYFLNRFATMTKNGLDNNNQSLVNSGLANLSSYFITVGIIVIILLAFCVLILAIGVSSPESFRSQ